MPLDSVNVGANVRPINVTGDPIVAANQQNVLTVAAATSLAGKFAAAVASFPSVLNAGGTWDPVLATPGITGLPAVCTEGQKATFCTGSIAITPAANATDIWTIFGSGTKTIRLLRLTVTGLATSAATQDVQLVKRSAANTGGTSTTPIAVTNDTNNAAATAALTLYSANPASLGATVGPARVKKLNLGAAGSAGEIVWDFGTRNGQGFVLRGATQGLAINWNGNAVPAGTSLNIDAEWVEDAS